MTDIEDPKIRATKYGWYAWDQKKCKRCNLPLGPWQTKLGQEFFGCPMCAYGVMCEGENLPNVDQAADMLMALIGN